MPQHNGIALGPNSPLLRRKRKSDGLLERDVQTAVMEALVGRVVAGQPRQMGGGLTGKYPELFLLNANNPNVGGRKKAAAGIAKAMGLLADTPDLHLPVMRGPFLSLYVEVKTESGVVSREQRIMHNRLFAEGNCVLVGFGTQQCVGMVLSYLALPRNWPSLLSQPLGSEYEHLTEWRNAALELLDPETYGHLERRS